VNRLIRDSGACDCHSHVYGPLSAYPLSTQRTFDPPVAPIEELESVWISLGIDRAVLVQGAAYGDDHSALLAALQRSPEARRGVALIHHTIGDGALAELSRNGIRAARVTWVQHLLTDGIRPHADRMDDILALYERIAPLGWHIEIHIDPLDLVALKREVLPAGMVIVIDHMARIDLSAPESDAELALLGEVLENPVFWVKMSGGDRLTRRCDDLRQALGAMRNIVRVAPDRCVWGLDWPHVNLARKQDDVALAELLFEAVCDEATLRKVLVENPARLYGFDDRAA